jgi:hypothetical protein
MDPFALIFSSGLIGMIIGGILAKTLRRTSLQQTEIQLNNDQFNALSPGTTVDIDGIPHLVVWGYHGLVDKDLNLYVQSSKTDKGARFDRTRKYNFNVSLRTEHALEEGYKGDPYSQIE